MNVEFVVHMDNRLREAVLRRSLRRQSRIPVFPIVMGILLATLPFVGWMLGTHVGWWWALLAGALILLPIFTYWTYKRAIRKTLDAANRLGDYDVTCRITDEQFEAKSPLGSAMLPWRAFTCLKRHPEFWLLYCTHATAYVLPAEVMAGEGGEFVIRKVRENGGKVKWPPRRTAECENTSQ